MNLRFKSLAVALCALFTLSGLLQAQSTKFFMYSPSNDTEFPGGTEDAIYKPKKAAEILSWSFSTSNTIDIGSITGGGGAGRTTFDGLQITFVGEPAILPKIFGKLVTGGHYDKLNLEELSGTTVTLKLEMFLVFLENVQMTGTQGDRAVYTASVKFGAIKMSTFKFLPNGTVAAAGEQSWSIVNNTETTNVE